MKSKFHNAVLLLCLATLGMLCFSKPISVSAGSCNPLDPEFSFSADYKNCLPEGISTSLTNDSGDPKVFAKNLADWGFRIAAGLAVIFIAIYALRLLFQGQDESKRREIYKGLTYSIIGFIVVVLAYAIVTIALQFVFYQ